MDINFIVNSMKEMRHAVRQSGVYIKDIIDFDESPWQDYDIGLMLFWEDPKGNPTMSPIQVILNLDNVPPIEYMAPPSPNWMHVRAEELAQYKNENEVPEFWKVSYACDWGGEHLFFMALLASLNSPRLVTTRM
ncbi:hypothetical protein GWN42_22805, partial [candidate division KSB1 bacterium]|nr:hypothetical protein [candidate division KSB1 bacterium]